MIKAFARYVLREELSTLQEELSVTERRKNTWRDQYIDALMRWRDELNLRNALAEKHNDERDALLQQRRKETCSFCADGSSQPPYIFDSSKLSQEQLNALMAANASSGLEVVAVGEDISAQVFGKYQYCTGHDGHWYSDSDMRFGEPNEGAVARDGFVYMKSS